MLATLVLFVGTTTAQEFLRTTVRDFSYEHPDMERGIDFDVFIPETGIVDFNLGADRKPLFNESGLPYNTVSTRQNFDQWYRHVDGVNAHIVRLLGNSHSTNGFSFQSDSFFPIDNLLLGNQGFSKNYHFTMESRGTFVFTEGATARFTGDDDFWLFVDDRLVIDLGGVHDRLMAEADLASLGLIPGNEYPIHFFFAERHTTGSRFIFETSFDILQDAADIDGDGALTSFDLDELCKFGVGSNVQFLAFDVNQDTLVDEFDVESFLFASGSIEGDVDLDGAVGFSDFLILSGNFGRSDADWSQGDLNCDTQVRFDDFLKLSSQFGIVASNVAVSVPEAAGLHNWLAAALVLLLRIHFRIAALLAEVVQHDKTEPSNRPV